MLLQMFLDSANDLGMEEMLKRLFVGHVLGMFL